MVFLINSFVNSFTPNYREYKLVALISGVLATTPGQAIVIGDKEKTTGLTYVILSRNTDIKQLWPHGHRYDGYALYRESEIESLVRSHRPRYGNIFSTRPPAAERIF